MSWQASTSIKVEFRLYASVDLARVFWSMLRQRVSRTQHIGSLCHGAVNCLMRNRYADVWGSCARASTKCFDQITGVDLPRVADKQH